LSETRILLVEDQHELVDLLRLHLEDQGYRVDAAFDGVSGLDRALADPPDLVVLDIMLPGLSGLEVLRRLRVTNADLPVLMLTARAEELDKVLGLELGADDYLTKPFSIRELIARVRALLRRVEVQKPQAPGLEEELVFADLCIQPAKRRVILAGQGLELTAKEFDLLLVFARHPGRAYSRQELLDLVWGYQFGGYSHTVNSHINRLRGKLEPNGSPRFIRTVWGVGYRFAEPGELE
jgi:two-component system alkaline phosphatase synthesis response regulator PhoP